MSFYNHSKNNGQSKRKQPRPNFCRSWAAYRRGRTAATTSPGIETDEILKEALEFSRRQIPLANANGPRKPIWPKVCTCLTVTRCRTKSDISPVALPCCRTTKRGRTNRKCRNCIAGFIHGKQMPTN